MWPRRLPLGQGGSVSIVSDAAEIPCTVVGFDHLVLVTPDVERSLRFYAGELGLPTEREELWRAGTVPFPSVRIDATTVIDLLHGEATDEARADAADRAAGRRANLDHLCLVLAPTDIAALAASGRFRVIEGPATRWGAQGLATSVYILDPDDNVVELRVYDR